MQRHGKQSHGDNHHSEIAFCLKGGQTDFEVFDGERQAQMQPQSWFCHAVLCERALRQDLLGIEQCFHLDVPCHGYGVSKSQDFQAYCLGGHDSCGERFRPSSTGGLEHIPLQDDVADNSRFYSQTSGLHCIPRRTRTEGYTYSHPYTNRKEISREAVRLACVQMVPVGVQEVYDLTVGESSHYISYGGIISKNCGFDELTQFTETQYRFMFSRLRRLTGATVPIRMRGASNPGDTGHEWAKKRFVKPGRKGVPFIPARIRDNPHLDFADYVQSLNELDPITRRQMLAGDWDAFEGGRFRKEWFGEFRIEYDERRKIYWYILGNGEHIECQQCWNFCTVDPASRAEEINDYTVISTFAVTPRKDILWLDAVRERIALDKICHRIAEVCQDWEPAWVGIEDVGFQLGILNEARRHPNIPAVRGLKPKGTGKLARATPAINRAEQGQIWIPAQMRMDNGDEAFPWIEDCIGELVQFTGDDEVDAHDDVVDTLSYAIQELDCLGLAAPIVVNPENYEDTQRDKPNSIFSRR